MSVYDCWKMAKSEFLYWFYDDDLTTLPRVNKSASEAASISQFAFWYYYVIVLAFVLFPWDEALINILGVMIWHWCGVEDLFYFLMSNFIKLPKEYLDSHPNYLGIPDSLYWLSEPRKIWKITIPSIIGFVCGKEVKRWKFVLFTISVIILTIGIAYV
jgi:hypothetical protein